MKKHLTLGAAVLGCALLVPRAQAVDLVLKSRAVCPGRPGSLPVSAVNVIGPGGLVGFDMALKFRPRLAVVPDPQNAFFYNRTDPEYPVIITGTSFLINDPNTPDLYVGVVKGVYPFNTANLPNGAPAACIGLVKIAVPANVPRGAVMDYKPAPYFVMLLPPVPTLRPGATAAVSDLSIPNSEIKAETVTVPDTMPGLPAPRRGQTDLRVPLHEIAVGMPGDLNADGRVNFADAQILAAALRFFRPIQLTDYQRIVADVAPLNGYVPGQNLIGTGLYGGSYGDGKVDARDWEFLVARILGLSSARNFPVCE